MRWTHWWFVKKQGTRIIPLSEPKETDAEVIFFDKSRIDEGVVRAPFLRRNADLSRNHPVLKHSAKRIFL